MSRLQFAEDERAALTRMANAESSTVRASRRARIVLACGEMSVAEVARDLGFSYHTVRKWKDRFAEHGIDGLADTPRSGRPPVTPDMATQVLTRSLVQPPSDRWTTRLIADELGVSQTTVSRVRHSTFAGGQADDLPVLADHSAMLAFAHIGAEHRVLGLHAPAAPRAAHNKRRSIAVVDALETVLCGRLVAETAARRSDVTETATSLLRQAADATPADRTATLLIDFTLDDAARRWLSGNRRIATLTVPPQRWLAQLYSLARKVDDRQTPELLELQRRLRLWYQDPQGPFTWSRAEGHPGSDFRSAISGYNAIARNSDSAIVMRGLYESFADGSIYPGQRISERAVARRVQRSRGFVVDALRALVDDGLVHQDGAGHRFVPAPTYRDVTETYTARALLGATLIRRLAMSEAPLPDTVSDVLREVTRQAHAGNSEGAGSLDLELQDELARAAEMPRIEAMFVRLTLQIRLFVSILGLTYHYPVDDIVQDGVDIVSAIKSHDVDAAVAAWRRKEDMAARYMIDQLSSWMGR